MATRWIPFRSSMQDSLQIGRMIHVVPHGQELDAQSNGSCYFLSAVQHVRGAPGDAVKKLWM